MFETLIKEIRIGDSVRLILITGKEPEGTVIEIGENHILIQNHEGVKQRFFDKLIGGWEILNPSFIAISQIEKLSQDVNKESKETEKFEKKPGLKILGKIDLDKIDKKPTKSGKTKKNEIKKDIKNNQNKQEEGFPIQGKFSSFEDLGLAISEKEKDKLIPANAYIIKYSEERGFGFLRDPFEIEIYFNYKDIIDEELRERIKGVKQHQNIQVCCSLSKNWKGEKAVTIHLPWTVAKAVQKAKDLINLKDYINAKNIAEQILKSFPGNIDAESTLKLIEQKRKSTFYRPKGFDPIYFKAKKAKENKNYEEAIRLFLDSIENEEKLESSVKDLAATYQELGEIEKGIELLNQYISELPNNSSTFNFAANYFSAAGDYTSALIYLDKLEDISPNSKLPDVYSRKAFCLIQLQKFEDALEYVEDILHLRKEHPVALKMKERLLEAIRTGIYERLDAFIDDTDFSTFTGGLPPILHYALENCDYTGLTANVISQNKFSKTHLNQIKRLIAEAGKARPKERAKYLLTESKLIQILEPDNENELRSSLSRYCTAMAISYEVEKFNPEIARYFYLLSFELEEKWQTNARQVSYYFMTFLSSHINRNKTLSIEEILNQLKITDSTWSGIIELLISNSKISAVIVDRLYENIESRSESILKANSIYNISIEIKSLDDFRALWNKIREKRKQEHNKLYSVLKSIQKIDSLEEITQQLRNFEPFIKVPWIGNIDSRRIEDIFTVIYSSINTYHNQVNFDDKEKFKGLIIGQISQLQEEIEEQPTRFSYDGLLPLLKHIEILVNQSFKKVVESSVPKISFNILGDSRFIDDKGKVSVQIAIKNEKGCSPIHNLYINILPSKDYTLNENILSSSESIKGGEQRILTISLTINKSALTQDATIIYLKGSYITRNSDEPFEFEEQKLSVKFYSEDSFESIPNPFSAVADSGPVKDKSMFFGRDLLIEEISNSLLQQSTNKCIIIQGQKRSGKSSLLYHLKEHLKQTDKFVCISFSLGLTEDLNSASFYWQILNGISEYLEEYDSPDKSKPFYKNPKISELTVNPSIVFYDEIKAVLKEFSKYNSWKEKRLLLMIDEFTYLYSAILRNKISPDFMRTWKSLLEKGLFSSILVGQDVMPKFKQKFPNEFGVTEDRRLTYLKQEDAKQLIEKPIWDKKNNRSRYIGNAIDKIIDYTSLNPYYIQIFCARLVDFMNDNKLIVVTEADVSEVAKSFTEGSQALPRDKFDNLLNAGDADLEAIPERDTLEILRQIANNSRIIGSCSRDSIKLNGNEDYVDQILDDLIKRDVIVSPNKGYFRIQVQIFNDWLLKH